MKRTIVKFFSIFLIIAIAVTTLGFAAIPLKGIKLNVRNITLQTGKTYQLKVSFSPANTTQKLLIFTSGDKNIATVNNNGLVKAIKSGKTVITVTSTLNKKVIAKCNVTITQTLAKATLKWVLGGLGKQKDSDIVWNAWNEELKKYLPNTKVIFQVIPFSDYKMQWDLMMAASEKVDIGWWGWMQPYITEVNKGSYLPLNDLMDKYAPLLRKELPKILFEAATVNGKIYKINNYQMLAYADGIGIRTFKELSEKYWDREAFKKAFGSSNVPTQEQYDVIGNYLKKLKDNNEIRKGIEPTNFNINYNSREGAPINFNNFLGDPIWMLEGDWKVKSENPYLKLKYDNLNAWYNKGYIRKDILTLQKPREDEGKKDGYVLWTFPAQKGEAESLTLKYGFPIEVFETSSNYYLTGGETNTALTIPRTSRYPERAMMILELVNTTKGKDLYNMLAWGLEGKHYNKIEGNRIKTLDYDGSQAGAGVSYGIPKWVVGNVFNSYENQADVAGWLDHLTNLNKTAKTPRWRLFTFDPTNVQLELNKLIAVSKEYNMVWAFPDYEQKYKEYQRKLELAGIDTVVKEYQKQVDEHLKKLKIK